MASIGELGGYDLDFDGVIDEALAQIEFPAPDDSTTTPNFLPSHIASQDEHMTQIETQVERRWTASKQIAANLFSI